jgi:predicted membrane-bound mannosyltransferase
MLLAAPAALNVRTAKDRTTTLLMLGVILAGAALRLHGLDRTSIFNDEAASWSLARLPFLDMLRGTANDVHPPLYHVILYVTIRLFGDSAIALRLPSALMGIANIYLIYRLGTVLGPADGRVSYAGIWVTP